MKTFLPAHVAGTEVYVSSLARQLIQHGHEVAVVKPSYSQHTFSEYMYEGIRVLEYPEAQEVTKELITGKKLPAGIAAFRELLETHRPDIMHFHEISGSNGITIGHLRIARNLRIKVFFTLHLVRYVCKTSALLYKGTQPCDGVIHIRKCAACLLESRGINGSLASLVSTVSDMVRFGDGEAAGARNQLSALLNYPGYIRHHKEELEEIFLLSTKVFVLSPWFRDILVSNQLPATKMVVLPRALALNNIDNMLVARADKPGGIIRLVYVGRISRIKGLLFLLKTLAGLPYSNWELDIYGNVTEEDFYMECLAFTKDKPAYRWKGVLEPEEVINTLSRYDLLVFPTLVQEMAPLVTREAFAARLPVLAADLLANRNDIVEGQNGFLFRANDKKDLARALTAILRDPSLIDPAKLIFPDVPSFDVVTNAHERVYRDALLAVGNKVRAGKKILHCVNHFLPDQTAGTEVYTWALAKGLQQHGFEAEVAIPNYDSYVTDSYMHDGITVHRFAEPSLVDRDLQMGFRKPAGLNYFISLLETIRPDVVHFHELAGSNGFTVAHIEAAAAMGFKTVMTFHLAGYTCKAQSLMYKDREKCDGFIDEKRCSACMISIQSADGVGPTVSAAANMLYRAGINVSHIESRLSTALGYPFIMQKLKHDFQALTNACSKLILLTNWYREILLINGVEENKMILCPQGLIQQHKEDAVQPQIPTRPLRLIFVGRLSHFKGVHLLLEAARHFKATELEVDLYGQDLGDEYSRKCMAAIKRLPHVRWMGKIEPGRVIRVMQDYHALVLASTFSEMSPLVIQEAFAAGIPVIASDVYGNAEQVSDGREGWLFRYKDATHLRQVIRSLVSDPARLIQVKENLPQPRLFDKVIEEHLAIYHALIGAEQSTAVYA